MRSAAVISQGLDLSLDLRGISRESFVNVQYKLKKWALNPDDVPRIRCPSNSNPQTPGLSDAHCSCGTSPVELKSHLISSLWGDVSRESWTGQFLTLSESPRESLRARLEQAIGIRPRQGPPSFASATHHPNLEASRMCPTGLITK